MNEISKEKYMTTKELADVLEVDARTINGDVERFLESNFQKGLDFIRKCVQSAS